MPEVGGIIDYLILEKGDNERKSKVRVLLRKQVCMYICSVVSDSL